MDDQSFKNSIQKLLSADSFQEPLYLKDDEYGQQKLEVIDSSSNHNNDESKRKLNKVRPYSEFEFDFDENEDQIIQEESPWASSDPFTPFKSVKLHKNQAPLTKPPKFENSGRMSSFKELIKKVHY